jgi:hypothetical protein
MRVKLGLSHGLNVFEERVIVILGSRRAEVTGVWRRDNFRSRVGIIALSRMLRNTVTKQPLATQ